MHHSTHNPRPHTAQSTPFSSAFALAFLPLFVLRRHPERSEGPPHFLAGCLLTALFTLPTQAQWDLQDSHTTASLRGIHNVGGGVAWASGTDGTVLRTEDGGYLWQGCATPPGAEKLDFRGIQAFDENTAIVMSSGKGDLSRLYKTTDGCKSWKLLFTNPDKDGFWDAIQFDERMPYRPTSMYPQDGALIGDPVGGNIVIYTTHDGGDSWHSWSPKKDFRPAQANAGESLFAASNSSMAVPGINGQFVFATGGESGSRLSLNRVIAHSTERCGGLSRLSNFRWLRAPLQERSRSRRVTYTENYRRI